MEPPGLLIISYLVTMETLGAHSGQAADNIVASVTSTRGDIHIPSSEENCI